MMENRIKIAQLNVCSIRSKERDAIFFARKHALDIFALQETWLRDGDELKAPGFLWEGRNRQARGGGTGLLVSNTLRYKRRLDLECSGIEFVCIELQQTQRTLPMLVISLYVPPRNFQSMLKLSEFLSSLQGKHKVLLLGDFNAKHTNWGASSSDKMGRILLDAFISNGL